MRKKPVYRRVVYMGTKFSTTTTVVCRAVPRNTFEHVPEIEKSKLFMSVYFQTI